MSSCAADTDPQSCLKYSKDSVHHGLCEGVYEVADFQTAQEALADCHHNHTAVTFCGSQTSMTGASVPEGGVVIALLKQNRILDIGIDPKTKNPFVITEPGVILSDLKRAVLDQGFFYPPEPTSYQEAQIGATIATNATGADSFKYGPTSWYVDELEVLCANGDIKTLKRTKSIDKTHVKNFAGYNISGEPIDHIIGSEGTLALIKKAKLCLLPWQHTQTFLLLLPFSDFSKCMQAVTEITAADVSPRALELIGPGATDYFQQHKSCPPELTKEKSFLYIKEEYVDEKNYKTKVENWFQVLQKIYKSIEDADCLNRVFVAKTDQELKAIQDCRHFIPLKVNEEYFDYNQSGGGKIGTDWWVPLPHLYKTMMSTYQKAQKLKIPFLVFAHIGNGHPHWNFLTKNAEEKQLALNFVKEQCQQAAILGGGVAGEHGIGKIKRYLLPLQHSKETIDKMWHIKRQWDPHNILGRGNIFEENPHNT